MEEDEASFHQSEPPTFSKWAAVASSGNQSPASSLSTQTAATVPATRSSQKQPLQATSLHSSQEAASAASSSQGPGEKLPADVDTNRLIEDLAELLYVPHHHISVFRAEPRSSSSTGGSTGGTWMVRAGGVDALMMDIILSLSEQDKALSTFLGACRISARLHQRTAQDGLWRSRRKSSCEADRRACLEYTLTFPVSMAGCLVTALKKDADADHPQAPTPMGFEVDTVMVGLVTALNEHGFGTTNSCGNNHGWLWVEFEDCPVYNDFVETIYQQDKDFCNRFLASEDRCKTSMSLHVEGASEAGPAAGGGSAGGAGSPDGSDGGSSSCSASRQGSGGSDGGSGGKDDDGASSSAAPAALAGAPSQPASDTGPGTVPQSPSTSAAGGSMPPSLPSQTTASAVEHAGGEAVSTPEAGSSSQTPAGLGVPTLREAGVPESTVGPSSDSLTGPGNSTVGNSASRPVAANAGGQPGTIPPLADGGGAPSTIERACQTRVSIRVPLQYFHEFNWGVVRILQLAATAAGGAPARAGLMQRARNRRGA